MVRRAVVERGVGKCDRSDRVPPSRLGRRVVCAAPPVTQTATTIANIALHNFGRSTSSRDLSFVRRPDAQGAGYFCVVSPWLEARTDAARGTSSPSSRFRRSHRPLAWLTFDPDDVAACSVLARPPGGASVFGLSPSPCLIESLCRPASSRDVELYLWDWTSRLSSPVPSESTGGLQLTRPRTNGVWHRGRGSETNRPRGKAFQRLFSQRSRQNEAPVAGSPSPVRYCGKVFHSGYFNRSRAGTDNVVQGRRPLVRPFHRVSAHIFPEYGGQLLSTALSPWDTIFDMQASTPVQIAAGVPQLVDLPLVSQSPGIAPVSQP